MSNIILNKLFLYAGGLLKAKDFSKQEIEYALEMDWIKLVKNKIVITRTGEKACDTIQ